MKTRVIVCLLAFLLPFAVSTVVMAFEPWNQRHYPGSGLSPMVQKVGATSEMTWEALDGYGWPGWRDVVARSLDTNSTDSQSMGNALNFFLAQDGRGSILIKEKQGASIPDIRHHAVSTAFLEAKCGVSWATACVFLLNPIPVPAYYKAAAMTLWAYSSQAPVVRHETFHAIARACDQYRGGCPRADTGQWESAVICTGNPDTLMDCGGAARTVTAFDYETFVTAYPASTPFLQVQVPEWGGCNNNEKGTWCYNNFDGLWHWTVYIDNPISYAQEWRSDGGPWFCVAGCP